MRSQDLWKWSGIGLVLTVGMIHRIEAPSQRADARPKALLVFFAAAGAIIAAIASWQEPRFS